MLVERRRGTGRDPRRITIVSGQEMKEYTEERQNSSD